MICMGMDLEAISVRLPSMQTKSSFNHLSKLKWKTHPGQLSKTEGGSSLGKSGCASTINLKHNRQEKIKIKKKQRKEKECYTSDVFDWIWRSCINDLVIKIPCEDLSSAAGSQRRTKPIATLQSINRKQADRI